MKCLLCLSACLWEFLFLSHPCYNLFSESSPPASSSCLCGKAKQKRSDLTFALIVIRFIIICSGKQFCSLGSVISRTLFSHFSSQSLTQDSWKMAPHKCNKTSKLSKKQLALFYHGRWILHVLAINKTHQEHQQIFQITLQATLCSTTNKH